PARQVVSLHWQRPVSAWQVPPAVPTRHSRSLSHPHRPGGRMPPPQTNPPLPPWAVQSLAHPPQLFGSVARVASQPSPAAALQSAKPAAHAATLHAPALHPAVAWGREQGWQLAAPQPVAGSSRSTQACPHSLPLHSASASATSDSAWPSST